MNERIRIDVSPIMSCPKTSWSEVNNKRFKTIKPSIKDRLMRLIGIKNRFKLMRMETELAYFFKSLPYKLPRKIRGIGWRIKNFIEKEG